jgi:hypothetical protein
VTARWVRCGRSSQRCARVLLTACLLLLAATPARAAFDPDKASDDTRSLVQSGDYTFCTKPETPLLPRARDLCPLAGEIPGCSALVVACEDAVEKPSPPNELLVRLLRLLGRAAPYVAWGVIALLVALVVYLGVRALRAVRDEDLPVDIRPGADVVDLPPDAAPPEGTPAEALLRLADGARARGDGRTALLLYLAASLRALDDRGIVRVTRDRTNGEYVRACTDSAARADLRGIVGTVDAVQFGGVDATLDAVSAARERADRIVRGPSSATTPQLATSMMLLLVAGVVAFASGCDLSGGGSHANPAGRELLADLLVKQGATISPLRGSLADLAMDGSKGPVVILDAERVVLEEETREHLLAWVRQGGTLVIAGRPASWPSDLWAKSTGSYEPGTARVAIETRARQPVTDDDEDEPASAAPPPQVRHARIAHAQAMTWPSDERAPRAVARLDDGELYGALRSFGEGQVLGLASADLLTNLGLAVPGNPAALIALVTTLDRNDFVIARSEQGVSPPTNPLAGLLHIGLGPALVHLALFIPLLFFAFGVRQTAPRPDPPPRRRAFAEHIEAVGGLYARRRTADHALAVYAKYVDERLRARMGRGGDPASFLAARARVDAGEAAAIYAQATGTVPLADRRGEALRVLARLSALFARAMSRS